jgi:hypothetical protein
MNTQMYREGIHLGPSRSATRFRLCVCLLLQSGLPEAHKHLFVVPPWRRACFTTRGGASPRLLCPVFRGREPVYAGLWPRKGQRPLKHIVQHLVKHCTLCSVLTLRNVINTVLFLIMVLYIVQHLGLKALLNQVRHLEGAVARLNQA